MASITSYLYAHQSENVEPLAPCFFILSATLYPSRICVKVFTWNPMESATCISMLISLCTYEWHVILRLLLRISTKASSSKFFLGGTRLAFVFESAELYFLNAAS